MTLAEVFELLLATGDTVRFSAYDGSAHGPEDAPIRVHVRSPRALGHFMSAPGELGMGRAYVAGELEVSGDMYTALKTLQPSNLWSLSPTQWAEIARVVGPGLLERVPRPGVEVRLHGSRHSKRRDAQAIAHHYDVSNRFYAWVLGPSMAYTCAVYPDADATLEQAQFTKFDLVARKLGLSPGMRLLDVGCGWGGMVIHAAQHYGVKAIGVTLSRQQAEWAQQAIADAGLSNLAEVRHRDYRDVAEGGFDAISSIGLTEHIGRDNLSSYFRFLRSKLRPQGRLLNHCIMRPTTTAPLLKPRGFINRYVFPDGELMGLGAIASVMQDNGFEIRHEESLREHYAMTLAAWCANLDAHWDEALADVGQEKARVWRLYMAGSRLAFEENRLQLHQLLGVRTESGVADFPLRPDWERSNVDVRAVDPAANA